MRKIKTGLVHIYTGTGKGKTSAAIGLAVRAAGRGMKVYMQQFIKNAPCGAGVALKKLPNIRIEQCGRGCFIKRRPAGRDMNYARRGLERVRKIMAGGKFDMIIMDEVNPAMKCGLVDIAEIAELIRPRQQRPEIVLTGRDCPVSIIALADLVTEMREVKHPYRSGVGARKGIEF